MNVYWVGTGVGVSVGGSVADGTGVIVTVGGIALAKEKTVGVDSDGWTGVDVISGKLVGGCTGRSPVILHANKINVKAIPRHNIFR
jgi:hypothetical protein